jgi:hypothetical protein
LGGVGVILLGPVVYGFRRGVGVVGGVMFVGYLFGWGLGVGVGLGLGLGLGLELGLGVAR